MKNKTTIGYTTGVFDLFHIGHLNILKRAKGMCDELIVGVTTDRLTHELKGKGPIIPYEERAAIVNDIRHTDRVVPQDKIDEIGDWESLGFDIMFKGSDWKGTEKWNALEKEFEKRGVKVVYFPYTTTTSSTIVREVLYNIMEENGRTETHKQTGSE